MNKSLWIIDSTSRSYEFKLNDYVFVSDGKTRMFKFKQGEMENFRLLLELLEDSSYITIESHMGFDVFFTKSLTAIQIRMYDDE